MIDARGGGQAFHRLDVIFGAEYRVEVSHPDGIFTVGCAFSGLVCLASSQTVLALRRSPSIGSPKTFISTPRLRCSPSRP